MATCRNKMFTDEELYMISEGLLSLIRNISNAKSQVLTEKASKVLDDEIHRIIELNDKVCNTKGEKNGKI